MHFWCMERKNACSIFPVKKMLNLEENMWLSEAKQYIVGLTWRSELDSTSRKEAPRFEGRQQEGVVSKYRDRRSES